MKQMTPSEYYQLTPINSGTDKNITESDTLLRTLVEYLLSATGWYTKIPKLTLATGFDMNWVSHDKLSEAGIETKIYVDHSDEPTGNWTTYIYSIWYKGAACALVHASGKYSDQISIYVTDIQNFKQVIDTYITLAIDLTNIHNCVDDCIIEPDTPMISTLFFHKTNWKNTMI